MTLVNGATTAMIAVSAGCNALDTWAAVLTGFIAGWVYLGVRGLGEMMKCTHETFKMH